MSRSGTKRWFALALAAVPLGACSGAQQQSQPAAGFPQQVTAANGAVRIANMPRRIVSLAPTATEDLYAIGAGKQVVAVDSYSNYPRQAPRTALSGYTPSVEAVAKYRPDLVVVGEDNGNIVAQLQKLQIAVLLEPPAANLGEVYGQIAQLGQATGHAAGATTLTNTIERQIAQIARSVPRPSKPLTVYHELDQTFYSANSKTFIGQLYALLGLKNIADKARGSSNYPQLSDEYIIASNPDLVVLADTVCCGQNAATVAARPGWKNIAAVKNGDVVPVEDAIASEWGPRIVLLLGDVAAGVRKLEEQKG